MRAERASLMMRRMPRRKMLNYLLFIATIGGIYGLLALSLNLIWGGRAWSISASPASSPSAPMPRRC